jgi:DNA-binding LacI/PurR family transcriptional regulator
MSHATKGKGPADGVKSTKILPGKGVNLRTLSEYLQLSQATISLVLNDAPAGRSIPIQTRTRVLEAAKRFQYRPSYFARSLRQRKSMAVGILTPDLSEGYFTRVMEGVQQTLMESHYLYFTATHYWNSELMERYPMLLEERAIDGFLLLNTQLSFDSHLPVVTISGHHRAANVTDIILDHDKAAELALEHLSGLGHTSIAFMHGPAIIADSRYRWKSIERTAKRMQIAMHPELQIQLPESSPSPEMGYAATVQLMKQARHFTAIFCFNDIAAIGAAAAIRDAGCSVPADISVLGLDDIHTAPFQNPKLTTVRQPLAEMGRAGAELLLKRIADPKAPFAASVVMQPELILRESTGRVKAEKSRKR